jgi:hypothetical protein
MLREANEKKYPRSTRLNARRNSMPVVTSYNVGTCKEFRAAGRHCRLAAVAFPCHRTAFPLSRLSQLRVFDAGFPALSAQAFFFASAHPSEHFTDADRSQGVHEFERAVDDASDPRPAPGVFDRRTTPRHRSRNQAFQARIPRPGPPAEKVSG